MMTKDDVDVARRDLLVRQQEAYEARFAQLKEQSDKEADAAIALSLIEQQDRCLNEIVGRINVIAQLDAKMALTDEQKAAIDKHATPMVEAVQAAVIADAG